MSKISKGLTVLVIACAFVFASTVAFAEEGGTYPPSGFSKGQKKGWNEGTVPPGWAKGKKKGWKGGTLPPGQASKVPPPPPIEDTTAT